MRINASGNVNHFVMSSVKPVNQAIERNMRDHAKLRIATSANSAYASNTDAFENERRDTTKSVVFTEIDYKIYHTFIKFHICNSDRSIPH